VDATYRADLRELNELNFARFDAKMGERLAELDAKWGGRWTALDAKVEQRIADVRAEIRVGLATLKGELTTEIGRARASTVKWLFTFWAPTALAIVGTAVGVVALLLRR
jgi:hypothetical protein